MSVRECDQCHFIKADGLRCKIRTCTTGPYCWIHTRIKYGVRVKPAMFGKGLFAAREFQPNEKVGEYTGDRLSRQQYNARYPGGIGSDYVLEKNPNLLIDARSTQSSVVRYANDCHNTGRPCNARLTVAASLRTTRHVNKGDEIMAPYGDEYWEEHDGGNQAKVVVPKATRPKAANKGKGRARR